MKNKSLGIVGLVAGTMMSLVASTSAFATSTVSYFCRSTYESQTGVVDWVYDFETLGNIGSMGPVRYNTGARLSIFRFVGDVNDETGSIEYFAEDVEVEVLSEKNGVLEFSLPGAVYSLYGSFDPHSDDGKPLKIKHWIEEDIRIDAPDSDSYCNAEIVG